MWRRQATGTIAEVIGRRECSAIIGTRLFKYRGDLAKELARYHPHGAAIVGAFVDGVNAYIAETERDPKLLPVEFRMLGTTPGPMDARGRHLAPSGLLGNVEEELKYGRARGARRRCVVTEVDGSIPAIWT